MNYIIDANNLAGKLDLLEKENFDKKLIEIIKNHFQGKNKIYLVFDSADLMGDKYEDDNVVVVYTPRDSYYNSADDKVAELTKNYLGNSKEEITVITDDIDLKEKIKKVAPENKKLFLKQATDFAEKLKLERKQEDDLSEDERDKIDDELLRIWK